MRTPQPSPAAVAAAYAAADALVTLPEVEVLRGTPSRVIYRLGGGEVLLSRSRIQPGSPLRLGERGALVIPRRLAALLTASS